MVSFDLKVKRNKDEMIEVKARIIDRNVFIPEEAIRCEITVTNVTKRDWKSKHQQQDVSSDSLAWTSAQVHCQCDYNERKLKFNKHQESQQQLTTSFQPTRAAKGHCLYSTEAKVLFCELNVKEGESKTFTYEESLPNSLPPSHRGHNLKLSYKVSVGIGRIGMPLVTINLPIRLLEMKSIYKALKERPSEGDKSDLPQQKQQQQENPFVESEKHSILDLAMDALMRFTVKRNLNTYNIQSASGCVGKFSLSKHYYRVGEDVVGYFEFPNNSIPCLKYKVMLQMEETISHHYLVEPPSSNNLVHYTCMSEHEQCTRMCTKTSFVLPIPITATPEFSHKIVSVRWRLHFEFVLETSPQDTQQQQETSSLEQINVENMVWNLPIHVVSTNPIQAAIMVQTNTSDSRLLHPS